MYLTGVYHVNSKEQISERTEIGEKCQVSQKQHKTDTSSYSGDQGMPSVRQNKFIPSWIIVKMQNSRNNDVQRKDEILQRMDN